MGFTKLFKFDNSTTIMILFGTAINIGTVLSGSLIGYFFHSRLPKKLVTTTFQAIGLFTIYIGITMAMRVHEILIMIFSMVFSSILGEWIDLEKYINRFSDWIKDQFKFKQPTFSEGMISAFLLFCMGSMTILGAFEEGTQSKSDLLIAKSIMDGISSIALASALGIGVAFSVIPLLFFQGSLTLLALWFGKLMPESVIDEMSAVGGLLLIGLGLSIISQLYIFLIPLA